MEEDWDEVEEIQDMNEKDKRWSSRLENAKSKYKQTKTVSKE